MANEKMGKTTASFSKKSSPVKNKPVYNQTKDAHSFSKQKQEEVKEETIMQPNMKQESTARAICANCAFWTGQASLKSAAGNFIEYADKTLLKDIFFLQVLHFCPCINQLIKGIFSLQVN